MSLMLEQLADELYAVLQEKHLSYGGCGGESEVTGDPDKLARVLTIFYEMQLPIVTRNED